MTELATHAAFLTNREGEICITLADAAFVQSDTIVVDPKTHQVFAVFHEAGYLLGSISDTMAKTFAATDHVLLSAERGDGTIFELTAPLRTSEWLEALSVNDQNIDFPGKKTGSGRGGYRPCSPSAKGAAA
ncbi:MAG: hypothetical protein JWO78_346 [Micavibrio sp.]|nr:hypothetical protein [Micavibrio sp.]